MRLSFERLRFVVLKNGVFLGFKSNCVIVKVGVCELDIIEFLIVLLINVIRIDSLIKN